MNLGLGVALLTSFTAAAQAAQADQDAVCLITMTNTVALARQRNDLPAEHLEAVNAFENSIGYFVGSTSSRYREDQLPEVIRDARQDFALAADKAKLTVQCDSRYRAALQRMQNATRAAGKE